MNRIILIGCGKTKRAHAAKAKELYTGNLFAARRAYAEASGQPWFIISALHAAISPEQVIEPYDVTLTRHSPRLYGWSCSVWNNLFRLLNTTQPMQFELHLGAVYAEPIIKHAREVCRYDHEFLQPVAHLGIGQQLAWYRQQMPDFVTIQTPL